MQQAASPLPGAGESLLHLPGPSASIREHQRRSCGVVLLGYSPKPYGSREPFGQLLSSPINNADRVVIDHSPELDRAASQVPSIVERRTISLRCSFELFVDDEKMADTPFASRCFYLLHPSN
ncbi:MAG: hypothetical protein E5V24_04030 [Mesorhizobium sp.]|nr:MAG: hypothetical protein E5V24_04030 [Mesorhizobium sp.]